jgi:hypothetical protein
MVDGTFIPAYQYEGTRSNIQVSIDGIRKTLEAFNNLSRQYSAASESISQLRRQAPLLHTLAYTPYSRLYPIERRSDVPDETARAYDVTVDLGNQEDPRGIRRVSVGIPYHLVKLRAGAAKVHIICFEDRETDSTCRVLCGRVSRLGVRILLGTEVPVIPGYSRLCTDCFSLIGRGVEEDSAEGLDRPITEHPPTPRPIGSTITGRLPDSSDSPSYQWVDIVGSIRSNGQ